MVPAPARPGRTASDRAGQVGLQVVDLLLPWAVALATLAARLATAARGPTDWDSSQYLAAVSRFDVTHGRPQPPGYWLYVVAGRLVHATGLGTVESLVLVAALASAAGAGLTVVAGRDLGGRWVGVAAGLLVATSPFVWFDGSIVATYSFDLVIAPLLIILAWRARPHSWHGAGALVALAVAAGFRQSEATMFLPLALLAVAGSVRRVREGVVAVAAGAVGAAAWFVPMVLAQPGGLTAWSRATHGETEGAVRASSVLDHAAGGAVNLGTFAAYTVVALLPLIALAGVAAVGLGLRAVFRATHPLRGDDVPVTVPESGPAPRSGPRPVPALPGIDDAAPSTAGATGGPRHRRRPPPWDRPWYQGRIAVLAAATLPPMATVALLQFAKGGYLLAYLPGAVIALLLVPGALLRPRPGRRPGVGARTWAVVATLVVVAIAALGTDRFLGASGVLPVRTHPGTQGAWFTQVRYQAPYADTRATIESADAVDARLARLGPRVDPARDVIVIDSLDGGLAFYRQAGWELPLQHVVLATPGAAVNDELGGSLYYTDRRTVAVGPGGAVYLIASPTLPGLTAATAAGRATPVPGARVGDYEVWRIEPGGSVLGVHVVAADGPRPLGAGIPDSTTVPLPSRSDGAAPTLRGLVAEAGQVPSSGCRSPSSASVRPGSRGSTTSGSAPSRRNT